MKKYIIAVQFIKYSIAGVIATGVHILVFYLCAWLLFPALSNNDVFIRLFHLAVTDIPDILRAKNSMIDNGIAFIASNTMAYIINVLWVFERGRHHRLIEIDLFFLVSGVSMLIGTPLMGFLISFFGMTTTLAFGANIAVAVIINFAFRKYIIFKK